MSIAKSLKLYGYAGPSVSYTDEPIKVSIILVSTIYVVSKC